MAGKTPKKSSSYGVKIRQLLEEIPEGCSTPDFEQKPVTLALQEGKNAIFRAVVCGDPRPEVRWECSKGGLSDSSKYQISSAPNSKEHVLQINKLTGEDTDVYRCVAVNKYGEAVCSARLTVIEVGFRKKRKRNQEPQEDLKQELMDLRMMLKKRAPLSTPEKKVDMQQVWQLLMTADRKDYERLCMKYGIVDFRGMLRKLQQMRKEREDRLAEYLNSVSNLRHISVTKDGIATFDLDMDLKDPESKIYLYKDGEEVSYNSGSQTKYSKQQLGNRHHFLIHDLWPEDAGIYQVKVEDADVFSTELEASAIPPRVVVPLAEACCEEHGDAAFECTLSKPCPSATWTFQHQPLRRSDQYEVSVSPDGLTHRLVVRGARFSDMGTYSLSTGLYSSSAWLVVEGKDKGLLSTSADQQVQGRGAQAPGADALRRTSSGGGRPGERGPAGGPLRGVRPASGLQPTAGPDRGGLGGHGYSSTGDERAADSAWGPGQARKGLLEAEGGRTAPARDELHREGAPDGSLLGGPRPQGRDLGSESGLTEGHEPDGGRDSDGDRRGATAGGWEAGSGRPQAGGPVSMGEGREPGEDRQGPGQLRGARVGPGVGSAASQGPQSRPMGSWSEGEGMEEILQGESLGEGGAGRGVHGGAGRGTARAAWGSGAGQGEAEDSEAVGGPGALQPPGGGGYSDKAGRGPEAWGAQAWGSGDHGGLGPALGQTPAAEGVQEHLASGGRKFLPGSRSPEPHAKGLWQAAGDGGPGGPGGQGRGLLGPWGQEGQRVAEAPGQAGDGYGSLQGYPGWAARERGAGEAGRMEAEHAGPQEDAGSALSRAGAWSGRGELPGALGLGAQGPGGTRGGTGESGGPGAVGSEPDSWNRTRSGRDEVGEAGSGGPGGLASRRDGGSGYFRGLSPGKGSGDGEGSGAPGDTWSAHAAGSGDPSVASGAPGGAEPEGRAGDRPGSRGPEALWSGHQGGRPAGGVSGRAGGLGNALGGPDGGLEGEARLRPEPGDTAGRQGPAGPGGEGGPGVSAVVEASREGRVGSEPGSFGRVRPRASPGHGGGFGASGTGVAFGEGGYEGGSGGSGAVQPGSLRAAGGASGEAGSGAPGGAAGRADDAWHPEAQVPRTGGSPEIQGPCGSGPVLGQGAGSPAAGPQQAGGRTAGRGGSGGLGPGDLGPGAEPGSRSGSGGGGGMGSVGEAGYGSGLGASEGMGLGNKAGHRDGLGESGVTRPGAEAGPRGGTGGFGEIGLESEKGCRDGSGPFGSDSLAAEGRGGPRGPEAVGHGSSVAAEGRGGPQGPEAVGHRSSLAAEGLGGPRGPEAVGHGSSLAAEGHGGPRGPEAVGYGSSLAAEGRGGPRGPDAVGHGSSLAAEGRGGPRGPEAVGHGSSLAAEGRGGPRGPDAVGHGSSLAAEGRGGPRGPEAVGHGSSLAAEGRGGPRGPEAVGHGSSLAAEGRGGPRGPEAEGHGSSLAAEGRGGPRGPEAVGHGSGSGAATEGSRGGSGSEGGPERSRRMGTGPVGGPGPGLGSEVTSMAGTADGQGSENGPEGSAALGTPGASGAVGSVGKAGSRGWRDGAGTPGSPGDRGPRGGEGGSADRAGGVRAPGSLEGQGAAKGSRAGTAALEPGLEGDFRKAGAGTADRGGIAGQGARASEGAGGSLLGDGGLAAARGRPAGTGPVLDSSQTPGDRDESVTESAEGRGASRARAPGREVGRGSAGAGNRPPGSMAAGSLQGEAATVSRTQEGTEGGRAWEGAAGQGEAGGGPGPRSLDSKGSAAGRGRTAGPGDSEGAQNGLEVPLGKQSSRDRSADTHRQGRGRLGRRGFLGSQGSLEAEDDKAQGPRTLKGDGRQVAEEPGGSDRRRGPPRSSSQAQPGAEAGAAERGTAGEARGRRQPPGGGDEACPGEMHDDQSRRPPSRLDSKTGSTEGRPAAHGQGRDAAPSPRPRRKPGAGDVSEEVRGHFFQGLADTEAQLGEDAVLTCTLSRDLGPGTWFKDGVQLSTQDGLVTEQDGLVRRLLIAHVQEAQAGRYTFAVGNQQSEATLTVKDPPVIAPEVRDSLKEPLVVKAGKPLAVKIPFRSRLPVQATWWKDGAQVDGGRGGGAQVALGDGFTRLCLPSASRKDRGQYSVTLRSKGGSVQAEVTLQVIDKPQPPQGPLEVQDCRGTGVCLRWRPPRDDGGRPVERYVVDRQQAGRSTWLKVGELPADSLTFTDAHVEKGKKYTFRVRAVTSEGAGEALESEEVLVAPEALPGPPSAPAILSASSRGITLTWTAPRGLGRAHILGYLIDKRKKGSSTWTAVTEQPVPERKWTVADLRHDCQYEFRVTVLGPSGPGQPGPPSEAVFARDPMSPPGPVRDLQVTDTSHTSITLRWAPPDAQDGDEAQGYVVELRDSDGLQWSPCHPGTVPTATYTAKGLRPRAGYFVRVTAVNDGGRGQPTALDTLVQAAPAAVSPRFLLGSSTKNSLMVRAGDTVRVPVKFEAAPMPEVTWLKDGLPLPKRSVTSTKDGLTQLLIPVASLSDSGLYTVQLRSPQGKEATHTFRLRVAANPLAPGPIRLQENVPGTVTAEWEPSPDEAGDVPLHYTVLTRSSGHGPWREAADHVHTNRFTLLGVLPGHEYYFRVVAKNELGASEPSDTSQPWCLPRRQERGAAKAPRLREPNLSQKPWFLVGLRPHLLPPGCECCMSCAVRGWPPPHVTWFKDDQSLEGNPAVYSTNVLGVCSLVIPSVSPEDSGQYKAVAENTLGQAVSTTTLMVTETSS